MARGVVKWFRAGKGTGAISSSELPPGRDAWVHLSMIEGPGPLTLEIGEAVDFEYEAAQQDSFDFRATRVQRVTADDVPVAGRPARSKGRSR
ncbi:cold-shock protein [Kineococcus endophyticus]